MKNPPHKNFGAIMIWRDEENLVFGEESTKLRSCPRLSLFARRNYGKCFLTGTLCGCIFVHTSYQRHIEEVPS